jgi:hypothetical protein
MSPACYPCTTARQMEPVGIEPTTSCLQGRCSPKLSYGPTSRTFRLRIFLFFLSWIFLRREEDAKHGPGLSRCPHIADTGGALDYCVFGPELHYTFLASSRTQGRRCVKKKRADLDSNQDFLRSLLSELYQLSYLRISGRGWIRTSVRANLPLPCHNMEEAGLEPATSDPRASALTTELLLRFPQQRQPTQDSLDLPSGLHGFYPDRHKFVVAVWFPVGYMRNLTLLELEC